MSQITILITVNDPEEEPETRTVELSTPQGISTDVDGIQRFIREELGKALHEAIEAKTYPEFGMTQCAIRAMLAN